HAAFGSRLRVVEMVRHPTDLAASWLRRGWGTRFGQDPWALTFCVRYGERDVPYYAIGWEEDYLAATPLGRIIRMLAWVWDECERIYAALPQEQRSQVCFVPYEGLIQEPLPHLERVATFLGTRLTAATLRFITRKGLPRAVRASERDARWTGLRAEATAEERIILERLSEEYEQVVRERCGAGGRR
ncbi:MAG: sulfotransferase domain-containing protein, partial [Candidatus Rokubacteria bacterium]|nr:sulfotransferase domain-containing protein [Candidatus Rokubacteria bacterium]